MRSPDWAEMLFPACAAMAMVSAAYPWAILFGGGRPLPFGLCYAMAVCALSAMSLTHRLRQSRARRSLLVVSGIAAAILAVWWVHGHAAGWWPEYWLGWIGRSRNGSFLPQTETIILTVLYWLSLGIANGEWGEVEAHELMTRGLVSFMLFVVAARLAEPPPQQGASQLAMPYALLFLSSMLLALAIARARTVRQRGGQMGAVQSTLSYSGLFLAVCVLLFIALASTPLLQRLIALVLSALWRVLHLLLMIVAVPIGYLAEWVIGAFRRMMRGKRLEQQPEPFRFGEGLQDLEEMLRSQPQETPLWLSIAFVAVVIAVVVIFVARRLVLPNMRNDGAVDEERESLTPRVSLRSLLRGLRVKRTRQLPKRAWVSGSIEELYYWLLLFGERMGRARQKHETPHEYQRALAERCPEKERFVSGVTDAFERSRYGNEVISQDELRQLASARDE